MNNNSIEKQVRGVLDQVYADKSGLNLKKPHYTKRDFSDEVVEEPVIDSYGEELIEHKSLNLMNQALLQQTALGKRDKPDNSEVDAQTAESK